VRVELWDSNPINNHPICLKRLHDVHEAAGPLPVDVECDSGAHIQLKVEPAHPRWGIGFNYELQTSGGIGVTRVLAESPAAREGLKRGDEILQIQGKPVGKMDEGEAQSLINSNSQVGIELLVRGADHAERHVKVKEGAIYPAVEDGIPVE
jgi:S1-C subfamily serine protease